MVTSSCRLLLALASLEAAASQAMPSSRNSEAEFTAAGNLMAVKPHRLLRRDETQTLHGSSDLETTQTKMDSGTAEAGKDPWVPSMTHAAPDFLLPYERMPTMPTCTLDVTTDEGQSDYGTGDHECNSCLPYKNCTNENKQQNIGMDWMFEPSLVSENAMAVQFFVNWTSISQMSCSNCAERGLRHVFGMSFASNAGEGVAGYEHTVLSFDAWMGPEVSGNVQSTIGDTQAFAGKHVFEVDDTEEPSEDADCNAANPAGRWIAIPGSIMGSETFQCERVCKSSHACNCGRHTGMRCTANIAMGSGQQFAYNITKINNQAVAMLDGNNWTGSEWEVTAEDLTETSPVKVVGRVILAGNSGDYGIKKLRQSHEHLGCVPCDLFYESTVVTGPFILEPPGIHLIKNATGYPPKQTDETCNFYKISALEGYAVKFETGPGMFPSFQQPDIVFSCPDAVQPPP